MEKSTVSRNLDRMRKKGWIEITNRDDGPSQVIGVTEKGAKLLAAVHAEWEKAQKRPVSFWARRGSVRCKRSTIP